MKGVRLDAEGGGASLDEETTAGLSERQKVPLGGTTEGVAEEGNPGVAGVVPEKGGRKVDDLRLMKTISLVDYMTDPVEKSLLEQMEVKWHGLSLGTNLQRPT